MQSDKIIEMQYKERYLLDKLFAKMSILDVNIKMFMDVLETVEKIINGGLTTPSSILALQYAYQMSQMGQSMLNAVQKIDLNSNTDCVEDVAEQFATDFSKFVSPPQAPSAEKPHGDAEPAAPRASPRHHVAQQQPTARVNKPVNIATLENLNDDTATLSKLKQFFRDKCQNGPLSYFHCVLDPNSLSRTQQNIYNVSSLVESGHVDVIMDDELGFPMIHLTSSEEETDNPDIAREKVFIVHLNEDIWRGLIEACKMPTSL